MKIPWVWTRLISTNVVVLDMEQKLANKLTFDLTPFIWYTVILMMFHGNVVFASCVSGYGEFHLKVYWNSTWVCFLESFLAWLFYKWVSIICVTSNVQAIINILCMCGSSKKLFNNRKMEFPEKNFKI